jgi:fructokinase
VVSDAGYAVTIGEALIDLIEDREHATFRPVPGGSPLNVAVGIARLGADVEFVGSFGSDGFASLLRTFLKDNGVGIAGSIDCDVLTSLAVTTFDGVDPSFAFYGHPRSYGLLGSAALDSELLAGASVIHAGSIGLLEAPMYEAVTTAFNIEGAVRSLDPNVRLSMIGDLDGYRHSIETLFSIVDLVKLSMEDARVLYAETPIEAAQRIAGFGPRVVIVTLGREGVLELVDGTRIDVPGRSVNATDTTGAGDAFMAAVIAEIVRAGMPTDPDSWRDVLEFAVDVSAWTCCFPGGAIATPTRLEVASRFGPGSQA